MNDVTATESVLDRWMTLISAGIIVALGIIIFAVYKIDHREQSADQAASFAAVFIKSSPVVEQQLGEVRGMKEVKERHATGAARGWYLDYRVTGQDKTGTIEMRLTPNSNYGQWNVATADLQVGQQKPVTLR
jgi:Cytochrome oxidase complex assembly protein 1